MKNPTSKLFGESDLSWSLNIYNNSQMKYKYLLIESAF